MLIFPQSICEYYFTLCTTGSTSAYLGVILCVSGLEGDKLEVQRAPKVHCGDDVPVSDYTCQVEYQCCSSGSSPALTVAGG